MPMFFLKQQIAFLIVVAVLLVPLHSVAHDMKSGTAQGLCACQLLPTDYCADVPREQSDHLPGNSSGDCCDSEDCSPDASEPPGECNISLHFTGNQPFYSDSSSHILPVYFAIFVPSENCSLLNLLFSIDL